MTYIHKTLGLAVLAVCALGAVLASGASAAEFTAFNTNGGLHEGGTSTGTDLAEPAFSPEGGALQVKCPIGGNKYEGLSATGTEPTPLVEPTYTGCSAYFGGGTVGPATVKTNGCQYQFHITGGAADQYTGTTSIVCPAGVTGITIIANGCTIVVSGSKNTAVNGNTYTNDTKASPTDVVVDVNATNVNSTTSGGFFACGVSNGEHAAGTMESKVTTKAFNSSKQQIDLTVM
jgi:hypothetical protein